MGLQKILSRLEKNDKSLTKLNLWGNGIGDQGAKAIADVLETNTTLTKLDLWGNGIGDEGAQAIADVLETNTTLTKLDLTDIQIGAEGAQAIVGVLKTNTTLNELHLGDNSIGDEGAKKLADILETNTTLTKLNFQFNKIGDEGAKAIADVLETNTTLTKLHLGNNQIGDEGAKKLAEALETNKTLTILDLSYNNIGDEGAKKLADVLETNTTLTELHLWGSKVSGEAILERIKTSIERNKQIAIERNKKIATIKASLLKGAKIVRAEEGQISINGTQYNKDVVELAIKSIAKDLEPNAKDSESKKSHKETLINQLKDSSKSNNIYPLVKIINSRDNSGKNIFSPKEKNIFIEQFVELDYITPINATLLSSKQIKQEYIEDAKNNSKNQSSEALLSLPQDTVTSIIYWLLPSRIHEMYENKKANDQKAPEVQGDKGIEAKVVIESFIKNLFKPAANPASKIHTSLNAQRVAEGGVGR